MSDLKQIYQKLHKIGKCLKTKSNIEEPVLFDLENGIKIYHVYQKSIESTVGFFVPMGAMHERSGERGATYVLGNALLQGTLKHTSEFTTEHFKIILSRDCFGYHATVPTSLANNALQILANLASRKYLRKKFISEYLHNHLRPDERYENYFKLTLDRLMVNAYINTPLAHTIYALPQLRRNLTLKRILSYSDRLLNACNIIIVCVGPISIEIIKNWINEYFGSLSRTKATMNFPIRIRFKPGEWKQERDDVPVNVVLIGIEGPGYQDNYVDCCAMRIASYIVGHWDKSFGSVKDSSLAKNLSKSSLCENYRSFHKIYQITSLWGCYYESYEHNVEKVMSNVLQEWMKLCANRLTKKQVKRAISKFKRLELFNIKNTEDRFMDIVHEIIKGGKYRTLQERKKTYKKISARKISEVMMNYVFDRCPVVFISGKNNSVVDYKAIRDQMSFGP